MTDLREREGVGVVPDQRWLWKRTRRRRKRENPSLGAMEKKHYAMYVEINHEFGKRKN